MKPFSIAALLLTFSAAALFTPTSAWAEQASPAKADAKAADAPPEWPRQIRTQEGVILSIYQPQVDEWKEGKYLKARAAFVLTAKDGKPQVGIVELSGRTVTDPQTRVVTIAGITPEKLRFPSLPEAEVPAAEALFRQVFPKRAVTVSLDRLAAGVERSREEVQPVAVKMDPPQILMSTRPAVLLRLDGKPVLAPVKGVEGLQFVVNTNWDLFFFKDSFYLLADKSWLSAKTLEGEWALAAELPAAFAKLPKGDQWDHVLAAIPPKVERGQTVPTVFYTNEAAELIVFDGTPVWQKVEGTGLLWGRNAQGWAFQSAKDQQLYVLLSGRWFRAADWKGPWAYAGGDLPEDFRRIPRDAPCGEVLASVPGTPEAADAVLMATIPTEAVVNKKEAQAKAKATYDGKPAFAPVEGTKLKYATNTTSDVLLVNGVYYLCQDGVWFQSTSATGPWVTCVAVPAEIYTIPPSSPLHRVVYVKVEPGTSDEVVVCSYTAGYYGAYVAATPYGTTLVWGTGYYYPPTVIYGGAVPVYYPWPATYGRAAYYNPWTGGYVTGGRVYGPYGSAGSAAWYNPNTGGYGRGARVTGPYGSQTVAAGYNPRTDTSWSTRQNYSGYAQWGSTAVRQGDEWAQMGHVITEDGAAAAWRGPEGGGHVWKGEDHSGGMAYHDGDFYAGHDGNVYKRDDDGNWSKYDDGDWNSVDKPDDVSRMSSSQKEAAQRDGKLGSTAQEDGRQQTAQERRSGEGEPRTREANTAEQGREGQRTRQEADRAGGEGAATTQRRANLDSETRSRLDRDFSSRERGAYRSEQSRSFQRNNDARGGNRGGGGEGRERGGRGRR